MTFRGPSDAHLPSSQPQLRDGVAGPLWPLSGRCEHPKPSRVAANGHVRSLTRWYAAPRGVRPRWLQAHGPWVGPDKAFTVVGHASCSCKLISLHNCARLLSSSSLLQRGAPITCERIFAQRSLPSFSILSSVPGILLDPSCDTTAQLNAPGGQPAMLSFRSACLRYCIGCARAGHGSDSSRPMLYQCHIPAASKGWLAASSKRV